MLLSNIFNRCSRFYPIQLKNVRYIRRRPTRPVSVQQQLVEDDDDDLFLEDAVENDLQFANELGHRPINQGQGKITERKRQQDFVKRKIIEKKEKALYQPKEPNLLTWAAQMQIKHLNKHEPDVWTPEALSQSFPISKDTIIKILKSSRIPEDEVEIYKHDQRVYRNWLQLKAASDNHTEAGIDGGPINPAYRLLVEGEKMSLMLNATGILSLPKPKLKEILKTQKELAEKRRLKVKGKFSAILDSYERDKERVNLNEKKGEKKELGMRHIAFHEPEMMALLKDISEQNSEQADSANEGQGYAVTKDRYVEGEQWGQGLKVTKGELIESEQWDQGRKFQGGYIEDEHFDHTQRKEITKVGHINDKQSDHRRKFTKGRHIDSEQGDHNRMLQDFKMGAHYEGEHGGQGRMREADTWSGHFEDEQGRRGRNKNWRERRLDLDNEPEVVVDSSNIDVLKMLNTGKVGETLGSDVSNDKLFGSDRKTYDLDNDTEMNDLDHFSANNLNENKHRNRDKLKYSTYKKNEIRNKYSEDMAKDSGEDDSINYLSGTLDDIDLTKDERSDQSKGTKHKGKQTGYEKSGLRKGTQYKGKQIRNEKSGQCKGTQYKVKQMGNEVYSETGEFLYRLPY